MLESASRCLLLATSLAVLVALAPLGGASPLEELRDQANDAVPGGTPLDPVADEVLGSGDPAGGEEEPKADDEPADDDPADDEAEPQPDDDPEPQPSPLGQVVPTQTVRDGLALAGLAVGTALGLLPEDPVEFLGQQVEPIQDAAEEVLVPDVREIDEPAPASATISAVEGPSMSPQMLAAGAGAAAAAALVAFWLAGSSGSVSAGATAASGGQLRRLLPFASPLFTRFEKDTVLGHPKRENLYALILQDPGVSLQSLCDATGLSRTAVTHHLRLLELQHLIVSKRMGRSRHYFENGGRFGRDQKEAYAVLHNDRSKDVARYVRDHPGAIQKALCESLGIQPSIAHWHLRRLQQAQLVEAVRSGRTVAYFPAPGLKALDQPVVPAEVVTVEVAPMPELAPPMPAPLLRALPA